MIKNLLKLLFLLPFIGFTQINANLVGNAINRANQCYFLTSDVPSQLGGMWFNDSIDFDDNFSFYFTANFGDKDLNGANGIALVFKPTMTNALGTTGSSMAYDGINNSLAIEFDTFYNMNNNDPNYDHIAIQKNGGVDHNVTNTLAGPVQASNTSINIEDDRAHTILIEWNATTKTMDIIFDCIQRLTMTEDVVNTIFNGSNHIYFGFVGATTSMSNTQQVCFNGSPVFQTSSLQDETICSNGAVQIDASIPTGINYTWTPSTGVSNPNIANPVFNPATTTSYNLTIDDICGGTIRKGFNVNVLPGRTPTFSPVAPICSGDVINPLPIVSENGVVGTWSPALDNTATTTYTFVPNNDISNCFNVDLTITVNDNVDPEFTPLGTICRDEQFTLPTTSENGISGTWSPAPNNQTTTTYTFTPNGAVCANTKTLTVDIVDPIQPTFNSTDSYCFNESIPELPTTSIEGITGSWSPAINNTATTVYTFTPDANFCTITASITIVIEELRPVTFTLQQDYCESDEIPALPTVSDEGIEGSWSPAINNLTTTTYTFTPHENLCFQPTTHTIVISELIQPTFLAIGAYCQYEEIPEITTTSLEGITGTWSPSLNNKETTTYVFTPSEDFCAYTTVITIPIDPIDDMDLTANVDKSGSRSSVTALIPWSTSEVEYQLNDSEWQSDTEFDTTDLCGEQELRVRRVSGCGAVTTTKFTVANYPQFFTPNQDGFNDTWTVTCLIDNPTARINVFNRYGTLVASFTGNDPGWNGNLNNNLMPESDYWFKATYEDNGVNRTMNGHFALKR